MRRKLVYACIYIKYIPHEGKKLRKLDRVNYDNKLCVKLKYIYDDTSGTNTLSYEYVILNVISYLPYLSQ